MYYSHRGIYYLQRINDKTIYYFFLFIFLFLPCGFFLTGVQFRMVKWGYNREALHFMLSMHIMLCKQVEVHEQNCVAEQRNQGLNLTNNKEFLSYDTRIPLVYSMLLEKQMFGCTWPNTSNRTMKCPVFVQPGTHFHNPCLLTFAVSKCFK